jgi:hypothetical protein
LIPYYSNLFICIFNFYCWFFLLVVLFYVLQFSRFNVDVCNLF